MRNFIMIIFLLIILGCHQNSRKNLIGFWEGPHPEDATMKFYFHLSKNNETLKGLAYWTKNGHYISEFNIDSLEITNNQISVYIPMWECYYKGYIINDKTIEGGFQCPEEPFDSVTLIKNNAIQKALMPIKKPFTYTQPQQFDQVIIAGRFESSNDSLFIDSLLNEINEGTYGRINSFLVLKDDKLICEQYFYGYKRNVLHPIESCTKSITSLLIGIAIDQGKIKSTQQSLKSLLNSYPTACQNITLQHLLTMTSGYKVNDQAIFHSSDRIGNALKRETLDSEIGVFQYDGGNTEILGAVLKEKTGLFADAYADTFLFKPLAIKNYNWNVLKQNGFPSMGGSLELRPVDMIKLGFLVLNNGKYGNHQIISEKWITESTSIKTKTHIDGDYYSYQWWNINLSSKGKSYPTIWANGFGGQFIYIIPSLNTVIVTTGYNYENDSWAITQGINKYLYLLNY